MMARNTTIAEQAALIADLREIAAKHKLAEAALQPSADAAIGPQPGGLL